MGKILLTIIAALFAWLSFENIQHIRDAEYFYANAKIQDGTVVGVKDESVCHQNKYGKYSCSNYEAYDFKFEENGVGKTLKTPKMKGGSFKAGDLSKIYVLGDEIRAESKNIGFIDYFWLILQALISILCIKSIMEKIRTDTGFINKGSTSDAIGFSILFIVGFFTIISIPGIIVYFISNHIESLYPRLGSPFIPLVMITYLAVLIIFYIFTGFRRNFIAMMKFERTGKVYQLGEYAKGIYRIKANEDFRGARFDVKLNCYLIMDYGTKNAKPLFAFPGIINSSNGMQIPESGLDFAAGNEYMIAYSVKIPEKKDFDEVGFTPDMFKFEIEIKSDLNSGIAGINYKTILIDVIYNG